MKALLVFAPALLLATTLPAEAPIAPIQKLEERWAALLKNGHVDQLSAIYDEDAWLVMPAMPPARGRVAIRAALKGLGQYVASLSLQTTSVAPLGRDYLVENGVARLRSRVHPDIIEKSNYQVIWRRSAGSWSIARDMVSAG